MTYKDVLEQHKANWKFEEVTFEEYYSAVDNILNKIRFKPTPEQLNFLLHIDDITMVDSTAGSGKTTTIVIKSILDEILWGVDPEKILFLTFSRKSAEDMKYKRTSIVQKTFEKNNFVRMSTLHSLCYTLLTMYTKEAGLHYFDKSFIIQDDLYSIGDIDAEELQANVDFSEIDFEDFGDIGIYDLQGQSGGGGSSGVTSIDIMKKFIEGNEEYKYLDNYVEMRNIMSAIAYQKECMLTDEELEKERIFQSMQCSLQHFKQIKKDVEEYKKIFGYLDFTDMQVYTLKLLKDNKDLLYDNVSFDKMFQVEKIYVDEFQDMTPLQKELVKELREFKTFSREEPKCLVCIGDGDQTIYTWRGSDTLEFDKFQKLFDPSKEHSTLMTFSLNHRCGSNIVEVANNLININELRNPKDIKATGREGNFEVKTYSNTKDLVKQMVREIKYIQEKEGDEALENTAIIYREHSQALGLVTAFIRENIDFNLQGSKIPYKHWIYRNVIDICKTLLFADDMSYFDTLYKFTPLNPKMIDDFKREFLELQKKKGIGVTWIDVLEDRTRNGKPPYTDMKFIKDYKIMHKSLKTEGEPIKPVLEKVYSLYQMHNLNYVLDNLIDVSRNEIESVEMFIASTPSDEDYDKLLTNISKWDDQIDRSRRMKYGVKMLSMHSTKGLEFDKVFIIGLDNNYCPKDVYAQELSLKNRQEYIEEERRLLYVGITRAINDCTVYASITDPSMFLTELDNSYLKYVNPEKRNKNKLIVNFEKGSFTKYIPKSIKEELEWVLERYVNP